MVALAIPAIEVIADIVLAALAAVGIVGVGVAVDEEIKKRREKEVPPPPIPIPRTEPQTRTQTRKKCPMCPPDCDGKLREQNTNGWSEISIAYQARIGGMGFGPGFINEWEFNGVSFDGFDSSQCLLKEAKAKYDQFFNEFREVREWWKNGEIGLIDEVWRQAVAAQPRPPVQLKWYFMEPVSYRHFSKIIQAAYPDIEVIFES